MIVDQLINIDTYKGISNDIYEGLKFLANAKKDIKPGTYPINANVKAIVSEYYTVEVFERGYEAHKRVIDIQYPINGSERVKWSPIENMEVNIPYEEEKDRIFYIDSGPPLGELSAPCLFMAGYSRQKRADQLFSYLDRNYK